MPNSFVGHGNNESYRIIISMKMNIHGVTKPTIKKSIVFTSIEASTRLDFTFWIEEYGNRTRHPSVD
jgi:hypothetical protein